MVTYTNAGDGEPTRQHRPYKPKEGPRYDKEGRGPYYTWIEFPTGRKGLCALTVLILDKVYEDDFRDHPLSKRGVSETAIFKALLLLMPELDEDVRKKTGHGLTKSMVSGRIANMRRCNETGEHILGPEYPKNHKVLKPLLRKVDRRMKETHNQPGCLKDLPA